MKERVKSEGRKLPPNSVCVCVFVRAPVCVWMEVCVVVNVCVPVIIEVCKSVKCVNVSGFYMDVLVVDLVYQ